MWSQTVSTRHLYTAAPHTADVEMLNGAGNKARVQVSGAFRACCARAAICGVQQ